MEFVSMLENSDALQSYSKILQEAEEERRKCSEIFSFFSIISDHYYRETFHSDIIRSILNPNEPEIGEINESVLLKQLFGLLGIDEGEYGLNRPYTVREESPANTAEQNGRIDIEITGKEVCIIIENKINWAAEQPNQLARDFSSRIEKYKRVIGICLFPMPSDLSVPDYEGWDSEYSDIKNRVIDPSEKTVQLYMWAVNNCGFILDKDWIKTSFAEFIENGMKRIENQFNKVSLIDNVVTAYQLYKQYFNLLRRNQIIMDKQEDQVKFVEYVNTHSEFREMLTKGADCWNYNRYGVFNKFFYNKFIECEDYKKIIPSIRQIKFKAYKYYLLVESSTYYLLYYANQNQYIGNQLDLYLCRKDAKELTEEEREYLLRILSSSVKDIWDGKPSPWYGYSVHVCNPFIENASFDHMYDIVSSELKQLVENAKKDLS